MNELPLTLQIMKLRSEIGQLSHAIHSLKKSGMDSASAQLLIVRKRAELESLYSGHNRKAESPELQ